MSPKKAKRVTNVQLLRGKSNKIVVAPRSAPSKKTNQLQKKVAVGKVVSGTRKPVTTPAVAKTVKVREPAATRKSKLVPTDKRKNSSTAPYVIVELTEEELKKHERGRRNWEGNSDSDGSVDSGVLEENICHECGELTADLPPEEWSSLIICDRCELDYHTICVGFSEGDPLPRHAWTCPKCVEEEKAMRALDFSFPRCREIFDALKVKKARVLEFVAPLKHSRTKVEVEVESLYGRPYASKKKKPSDICYSPSRPMELAWSEGQQKGYMMVSRVFPYDVMRKLTHGCIESYTLSGRVCDRWEGFVNELTNRINAGGKNIVNRGGRWDITLPKFVVDQLELPKLLAPITERLCSMMNQMPPPQLRTHNIVLAPVGSLCQQWHSDDTLTKLQQHRYFTILIALNTIGMCH
jgi:hypothetical protein